MKNKILGVIGAICIFATSLECATYAESAQLTKPVVGFNQTKQKYVTTFDTISFGNYPQSEVTSGDAVFSQLEKTENWENDEVVIDGIKYCRKKPINDYNWKFLHSEEFLKKTNYSVFKWGPSNWYNLDNKDLEYHYFKFEPIKWRILSIDGTTALVMSDQVLDCTMYDNTWFRGDYKENIDVIWKETNLNKYLNEKFANIAFTEKEIQSMSSDKEDWTVADKLTMLSEKMLEGENSETLGFMITDDDNSTLSAGSTDYAWAMGCYRGNGNDVSSIGYSSWWLIPEDGTNADTTGRYVTLSGEMYGTRKDSYYTGIRPITYINLDSDVYSYVGKGTTDLQLYGDFDKNDCVTMLDVLNALKYSLGTEDCPKEDIFIGDKDNDGNISLQEVLELLQISLGVAENIRLQ